MIRFLCELEINSIKSKIPKSLIDNKISLVDLAVIINKEKNYFELKESIRMMKSQRRNIERNKLVEDGKRIVIDEIIKQNIRPSPKYKARLSYYLKCKENTKNKSKSFKN